MSTAQAEKKSTTSRRQKALEKFLWEPKAEEKLQKTVSKELKPPKKPSKKKDDEFYFCMKDDDYVKCFQKEGKYTCWFYYPVYDDREIKWVNIKKKVGEFSDVFSIGTSSQGEAKSGSIKIVTGMDNTRCYAEDKELRCFLPSKDTHDLGEYTCPKSNL